MEALCTIYLWVGYLSMAEILKTACQSSMLSNNGVTLSLFKRTNKSPYHFGQMGTEATATEVTAIYIGT